MSAGYYKDNCPSGHTCRDAAPSTYLKSSITYGEILDTRDYQVYKTVKICNDDKSSCQTWMAQNLNYNYDKITAKSYCYDNNPINCNTYGRLYLWSAAMDSAKVFSSSGKGCGDGKTCSVSGTVRGVCPAGWHLPSSAEWQTLFDNVGRNDLEGSKLKSGSGWKDGCNGENTYGFSAIPTGYGTSTGKFAKASDYANFWSSTEHDIGFVYVEVFYVYAAYVEQTYGYKDGALSVRCLKDN